MVVRHTEQPIRLSTDYQGTADQQYEKGKENPTMTNQSPAAAAGRFTFPGTSITVNRMGYGAMQLSRFV
jgi:hypothetical protein